MQEKWLDATVTLDQLASQLGADHHTLSKQAARLSLPFPRPGGRGIRQEAKTVLPIQEAEELFETKRERYRTSWLSAVEKHPKHKVRELQRMMPGAYNWLKNHDRIWLQEHSPLQRTKAPIGSTSSGAYWEQRDKVLAEQVRASAARLMAVPDHPIFISRYAIATDLNQAGALDHQLDRLPLTAQALEEVCETREAYALRRIEWAAKIYRLEHHCLTRWQLIKRAGVAVLVKNPRVQEALEAALASMPSSAAL